MKLILQFLKDNKEYVLIIIFLLILLFFGIQIIKFNALKPFIYLMNNF